MNSLLELIRRPWVWRAGLALYVACLCGVIFAYFVVSAMQVPTALYLHGPARLHVGESVGLRGHLLDAQDGQRIRSVTRLSMALEGPGQVIALPAPEMHYPSGEILGRLHAPGDAPPGEYTLVVRARRTIDAPEFVARAPVRFLARAPEPAIDAWPTSGERRPAKEHGLPRVGVITSSGEVSIDLLAERPVLGNALPGHVTLRTTLRTTGAPLACEVTFVTSQGMIDGEPLPAAVTTNAVGLHTLKFTPITLHQWELEASCTPPAGVTTDDMPDATADAVLTGQAKVQVDVAATQFELQMIDASAARGASHQANLATIHKDGSALIDLYHGDTWLWAGTFGYRDYRGGVTIPDGIVSTGLHRIQVHDDIYSSGFAWDSASFWVPSTPSGKNQSSLEQAIDELLAFHITHTTDEARKRPLVQLATRESWRALNKSGKRELLDALLDALPVTYADSTPLVNSFDEDQRELEAWKQSVRGELLMVVGAALLTGLALLALIVAWGIEQAQRRQRLYDEVAEELGDHDQDVSATPRGRSANAAMVLLWVQGGVVFGTLVVFAGCIWMLMRYMM